jgi:hypothetical protein
MRAFRTTIFSRLKIILNSVIDIATESFFEGTAHHVN